MSYFPLTNEKSPDFSVRLMRVLRGLALGAALLIAASSVSAQSLISDADWAIFVSNRSGPTELYLIDLNTRQVSQLTDTGRAHITPYIAPGARMITYASREGSSYEIFTAQISSAWRTRRPTLVAVNRLTYSPIGEDSPSLSSDGSRVVFRSDNGIEVMSVTGEDRRVLVPHSNDWFSFNPIISPDGQQVAYVANQSGANEIWVVSVSNGQARRLTSGSAVLGGLSWSADARRIAFTTSATTSKLSGIAIADAFQGSFQVLTEGNDGEAAISPGGTFVIFTSLRDGDPELYLLNLRTSSVERLTRNPGVDGSAVFVTMPSNPPRRLPSPGRRVSVDQERPEPHVYRNNRRQ
jgi:Tol biopolymer transport system component